MNDIRKNKLTKYLYPTKEIAEFMLYDFYVELINVLDRKTCFSNNNCKASVRTENLGKSKQIIKTFIKSNINYKKRINELYRKDISDDFISEILWGYILFVTTDINSGTGADVFWDKRSVCYKELSILDVE